MNVIHIVRQFSPAIGGLENFVLQLAKEQKASGLTVSIITLNKIFHTEQALADIDSIAGIKVCRLAYFGSYKYAIALSVLNHIKSADIIHIHGVDFFLDYLANSKILHRKKLVLSTHGGIFHTPYAASLKKVYFRFITKFSLRNVDKVFACSVNDHAIFSSITAKSKLKLIENGVDTEKFSMETTSVASSCSENNTSIQSQKLINTKPQTFIFIGRFSDNKRIDLLVHFFSQLIKFDSNYRLIIAGKDWDNNQSELEAMIEQRNLQQHISLIIEPSEAKLNQTIKHSRYIISASEFEGFGMTIIEGMSGGLVPITSKIPSFEKIVQTSHLGLTIDFESESSSILVHQYIQQLDFEKAALCAKRYAKQYSWRHVAGYFTAEYHQVVGTYSRDIQGVAVDTRNSEQVVNFISEQFTQGKQHFIAFANAHTVNLANQEADYKHTLSQFTVLNDGIGLEMASKLKYQKGFVENLNGTDFTPKLLANIGQSLRIYLLGAKAETVEKCLAIWQNAYPQHHFVGFHHGYVATEVEHQDIVKAIKKTKADTVIVAMGNPLQEQWIAKHLVNTEVKLAIGVGALFDFTVGNVSRAPKLMRKFKLEWFYRLCLEPRRMWKRYLIGNAIFLFNALKN